MDNGVRPARRAAITTGCSPTSGPPPRSRRRRTIRLSLRLVRIALATARATSRMPRSPTRSSGCGGVTRSTGRQTAMWHVKRLALGVLLIIAITAPLSCATGHRAVGDRAGEPDANRSHPQHAASGRHGGAAGRRLLLTAGAVACPPIPPIRRVASCPPTAAPVACRSAARAARQRSWHFATNTACHGRLLHLRSQVDDSGRGVFTCYATEAWKKRAH